jgi:hypothetical protein
MSRRVLIGLGQPTDDQERPRASAQREAIIGEVVLDATEQNSAAGEGRPAANEITEASFSQRLRAQAYRCGEVTMKHLVRAEYLSEGEANTILQSFGYYINDLPDRAGILDILAFLVWIKLESKDEKAVREIRNLTRVMTTAINGRISHCGFAHLTEMPIELYQSYPRIFEICSTLMCPVIQRNEKDFLTVASINPVTAAAAGLLIGKQMEKDAGMKPFVFVMTTGSNAWTWLCEKHFGK